MNMMSERSSRSINKLTGSKDLPRFMSEMNGQVQERFPEASKWWMKMVSNLRNDLDYDNDTDDIPFQPGPRPVYDIPHGLSLEEQAEAREGFKLVLEDWKYNNDRYSKYKTQAISLFGFIMNHLDTTAANRVRRDERFNDAENEADFMLLWIIIMGCHQMTGAAKHNEELRLCTEFNTIKISKNESLDDYCERFSNLLNQLILSKVKQDEALNATIFMKGLINSEYRSLAIECLSAPEPLRNSDIAMLRARNYQAILSENTMVEEQEHVTAALSTTKRYQNRNYNAKISDEDKFKIGKKNYNARKSVLKGKKSIKCYECEEIGHYAKDCPRNAKAKKKLKSKGKSKGNMKTKHRGETTSNATTEDSDTSDEESNSSDSSNE